MSFRLARMDFLIRLLTLALLVLPPLFLAIALLGNRMLLVPTALLTAIYVWIALYAACFLGRAMATVQLGVIGIAYAAVLVAQGAGEEASTRWAVTMTTLVVAVAVISRLVRELRRTMARMERVADDRERVLAASAGCGRKSAASCGCTSRAPTAWCGSSGAASGRGSSRPRSPRPSCAR